MGKKDEETKQQEPSVQSRGGKARAEKLDSERRSEIARTAALKRWQDDEVSTALQAQYGAPDRPLKIGSIEIPCYVLSDGTRVLAQRGLQSGIGMSEGGGRGGARRIASFMARLSSKGIDVRGLVARANSPIRFSPPHGGNLAFGYDAKILPDICAVIIDADQKGALDKRQKRFAERAATLQHGFATVGIIALVDEVTGYQYKRDRHDLERILGDFITEELGKWAKRFPDEFYQHLFRLRGWKSRPGSSRRPVQAAKDTIRLVYDRLAPGVRQELERKNPRVGGKRQHKHHQWLTEDIGHPKLREHIASVITLMRVSDNWSQFKAMIDKALPPYKPLPLLDALEDGKK